MTRKVVTVTLNPALDLTGSLENIILGKVSLVDRGHLHAAGKGVNVAKVLSDLGADVTVTGFLGADNQAAFVETFAAMRAHDEFVRVPGSTRINVKLVETHGRVSDINFPGIEIDSAAIQALTNKLTALCPDNDYFVFSGSLPPGVAPEQLADWISYLTGQGKKVVLDSSQAALEHGIKAKPWMIKPNQDELAELVQRPLTSRDELQSAAQQLANLGIKHVVVSMGATGAMWLSHGQWRTATPPSMELVSTVGAGDSFVAGFCWAAMQSFEAGKQLSFATAISALAVNQIGVGVSDINQVIGLKKQVIMQG
ncbi:1-phosphofructokinase [Vibrio sp. WXL210]|uniref:1-phosphofructokinase n=1 Tax=Vibrio sp. WXL210 TaxID=3450709 RepID=UPI003EC8486C